MLVVVGEMISLICLIGYLCYELCGTPKPDYQRMDSSRDEVPDLQNGYGSTQPGNGGIPVGGARIRKYSESVGRSYVASAVARFDIYLSEYQHPFLSFSGPCQFLVQLDLLLPDLASGVKIGGEEKQILLLLD